MSEPSSGRLLVGRYRLEAQVGRGGFGEVWRAKDVTLGRQVAAKIVDVGAAGVALDLATTVARFRREALAVGRLDHPGIATAFDAGQDGNLLFLIMELVPGESLAEMIRRRQLAGGAQFPVAEVLEVAEQVAEALAVAHRAGVVHRDIKPANLIVDASMRVKVIDFGIARVIADDLPRLTGPGQYLGTLAYASPEQAEGLLDLDGRADLYALGCTLYELLAGQQPFVADRVEVLVFMHLDQQAEPISSVRPDVPAELERLVFDLMAKKPADRPASARQVALRARSIRETLPPPAPGTWRSEADRATVLAPDDDRGELSDAVAGPVPLAPTKVAETSEAATARGEGTTAAQPAAPMPTTPAPPEQPPGLMRFGPGTGAGPGGQAYDWGPAARRPRRRRRRGWQRTLIVTVVTLAVAGGVAGVLWWKSHQVLKVTAVAVAPARAPGHKCDVTVDVVGTIITNGRAGQVAYQWIRTGGRTTGGRTTGVYTVSIPAGQTAQRVHLRWSFRGAGTRTVTARLRVLSPDVISGVTSFTYSCRR